MCRENVDYLSNCVNYLHLNTNTSQCRTLGKQCITDQASCLLLNPTQPKSNKAD